MNNRMLCLVSVVLMHSSIQANVSTNVPLRHWAYNAVDQLTQNGINESALPGTRPYTRLEMARLIVEATRDTQGVSPLSKRLIARLKDEFLHEVRLVQEPGLLLSSGYLKPIEDPYIRIIHGESTPMLENESGDSFRRDTNWRAGFASHGVFWNHIGFFIHPEYKEPWQTDTGVRIIEGYGKVDLGPFDIQLGKDSLWWGPGHHGAMIMSNNAEALTMLKVSNPSPVLLPWILKYLGPFKFTYFLSELEKERFQPKAKLTGLRLNIKPHPNIELGYSRTIMFGGNNFDTGLSDYLQIFWPKNIQNNEDQMAALDASLRIPMPKKTPWRAIKLYGEYAGEDAAGFSKYRPLLGIQVQDIGWRGSTNLRLEYAKTSIGRFPGVFYRHGIFRNGHTYRGRSIGHHIDAEARDVFVRLQHYFNANLVAGLDYDQEVQFPLYVERSQFGFDLTWFTRKNWELRGRYQYEDIKNDPSRPRWNHIIDLGVTYNF